MYHLSFECWESLSIDDACSSDVVGSDSIVTEDVDGDNFFLKSDSYGHQSSCCNARARSAPCTSRRVKYFLFEVPVWR